MPEIDWSYWDVITTHEAGHAVASFVLWQEVADIFVRDCRDEQGLPALAASFRISAILNQKMMTAPPLEVIHVCAAGAEAERLRLGIEQSKGFGTDYGKICMALAIAQCRGGVVEAAAKAEVDGGYARTRDLLLSRQAALDALVTRQLDSIAAMFQSGNFIAGAVILAADQVREVLQAHVVGAAAEPGAAAECGGM